MAWSAPMTAVLNAAFTAAQFNQYLRDNLLETEAAKAQTPGALLITAAANSIAERLPTGSSYGNYESTNSSTYTGLPHATSVTATTGTMAAVFFTCGIYSTTANVTSRCSVAVSGATTLAASDSWCLSVSGLASSSKSLKRGMFNLFTGLTPGANTFTLQHKVDAGAGTGFFGNRTLAVIPL